MPLSADHVSGEPIKVMMVDDSAIIRGLYRRLLAQDPDVEVVNDAANGQQAVDRLALQHVDVIILDIEMPIMDGLTAIPKLLEVQPSVTIVMASTLTAGNASISLRALEAGAADYIQKPTTNTELSMGQDFRSELLLKVKTLGEVGRQKAKKPRKAPPSTPDVAAKSIPREPWNIPAQTDVKLRKPGIVKPKLIAVGSSTGGPQALRRFFDVLSPDVGVPVVITQHMPPTFTAILAEHINKMTAWECREAVQGDILKPGLALIAPGGYHMTIDKVGGTPTANLNQDPPENFCRPAVDPMFRSIAKTYGASVLCVILTGMGNDGLKGSRDIVEAGGTIFAQDEETSVVWGMPGSVAGAGICSVIAPLEELPAHITQFVSRVL